MSILELSQHLRHQEYMLSNATTKEQKRYHQNLINYFSNRMIRLQKGDLR